MQVVHATYREGFGEAVQVPSILRIPTSKKCWVVLPAVGTLDSVACCTCAPARPPETST
jgi:hypothetical protein